MPTNPFAGADYEAGVNQSTVEGTVTQGSSSASTVMGAAQAAGVGGKGFGALGSSLKKGASSAFELLNPANARRAISGLLSGGGNSLGKAVPDVGFDPGNGVATPANEDDWRVRISLPDNSLLFYKKVGGAADNLMIPLQETNGVVWPYIPSISVTHQASYSTAALTHSNYPAHFYNNSEVNDITISGEFTVQSKEEGQYLMAAVYFFRAATKMFFGQGSNAGNPPPMVFLDGYGSHYFPHVPGVITNFTHTMPADCDYIQIPISMTSMTETSVEIPSKESLENRQVSYLENDGLKYQPNWGHTGSAAQDAKLAANNAKMNTTKTEFKTLTSTTRVPTVSTISVTFRPVYSRKNLHDRFNLDDFADGKMIQDKDKGYGGFI